MIERKANESIRDSSSTMSAFWQLCMEAISSCDC